MKARKRQLKRSFEMRKASLTTIHNNKPKRKVPLPQSRDLTLSMAIPMRTSLAPPTSNQAVLWVNSKRYWNHLVQRTLRRTKLLRLLTLKIFKQTSLKSQSEGRERRRCHPKISPLNFWKNKMWWWVEILLKLTTWSVSLIQRLIPFLLSATGTVTLSKKMKRFKFANRTLALHRQEGLQMVNIQLTTK